MCLVLIAWRVHRRCPLIVAANRDEFYARPTLPAQRWPGASGMIAGQDLEAGGSWMGVDATGRFAAVTNFRELEQGPADVRSRGELVTDYLLGDAPAESYLAELGARATRYRGYNLLLTGGSELYCASNRGAPVRHLPPGVHGVCNGPLDSDWPKVKRGRQLLAKAVDRTEPSPEQLLELLRDQTRPADEVLPDTGVGLESERLLGTIAIDGTISGKGYGTRSASVLLLDEQGRGQFVEQSRMDDASWQQREFPIGPT
jgi:uncharacterized protein with NRDE domain